MMMMMMMMMMIIIIIIIPVALKMKTSKYCSYLGSHNVDKYTLIEFLQFI
jgi:hypothetical protein